MKRFPFPEIWVQRQRYHPSLVIAQCANLSLSRTKDMVLAWVREFLKYHCHVAPPVTQSLSELIPCLGGVSPVGQLDSWSPEKQRVKPRMCLLLSRSPRGVWGQGKLLFAEIMHCHPLGAPQGLRSYSKEPQTCRTALNRALWLGLCVWRLIQAGSQGTNKWDSKILSIHQTFSGIEVQVLIL